MPYSDTKLLTIKDVKNLLSVQDLRTAKKYFEDIKLTYNCPAVLYIHFKQYFKVQ